jgi:hypothetical protein
MYAPNWDESVVLSASQVNLINPVLVHILVAKSGRMIFCLAL